MRSDHSRLPIRLVDCVPSIERAREGIEFEVRRFDLETRAQLEEMNALDFVHPGADTVRDPLPGYGLARNGDTQRRCYKGRIRLRSYDELLFG